MSSWDNISLPPELERIAAQADQPGLRRATPAPGGGHAGHAAAHPAQPPQPAAAAGDVVRLSGGAQILQWLTAGRTIPEIAQELGLEVKEVDALLAEAVQQATPAGLAGIVSGGSAGVRAAVEGLAASSAPVATGTATAGPATAGPATAGPGTAPPIAAPPSEVLPPAFGRRRYRRRSSDRVRQESPWDWIELEQADENPTDAGAPDEAPSHPTYSGTA